MVIIEHKKGLAKKKQAGFHEHGKRDAGKKISRTDFAFSEERGEAVVLADASELTERDIKFLTSIPGDVLFLSLGRDDEMDGG